MEPTCQTCRYWVAYNRPNEVATRGECTYPLTPDARIQYGNTGEMPAMLTPFDWSCQAYAERPAAGGDEPQSCPGG